MVRKVYGGKAPIDQLEEKPKRFKTYIHGQYIESDEPIIAPDQSKSPYLSHEEDLKGRRAYSNHVENEIEEKLKERKLDELKEQEKRLRDLGNVVRDIGSQLTKEQYINMYNKFSNQYESENDILKQIDLIDKFIDQAKILLDYDYVHHGVPKELRIKEKEIFNKPIKEEKPQIKEDESLLEMAFNKLLGAELPHTLDLITPEQKRKDAIEIEEHFIAPNMKIQEEPIGEKKTEEEKASFDDLKHPPLQGIKDYSHDRILKFVKDHPEYSNTVLNQFIEGMFQGKLNYDEFNKIKDYLRLNDQSQIVKVIRKDQVLKPNRFKNQVKQVVLK